MSTHRPRRIGRGDAERMLRGGTVDTQAGPDSLADLLAAAAAPALTSELAGEEAAVAAFRETRLTPATQPRRDSMIKIGLAKLLTVKVAAVAIAATTVSSVAVAASTGILPSPVGSDSPAAQRTTSASASAHASASAGHGPNASAAVSASLVGLCHAYTAGATDNPGKALDTPAFTALVTAAGGKDKVATYCAAALKTDLAAGESAHPTGTATPTTEPESPSAGLGKGNATTGADNRTTGVDTQGEAHHSEGTTLPPGAQAGATVAPKVGLEATVAPGKKLGTSVQATANGE
ncbi:hypothetical protein [Frankia sp. Cr1]|uniref:hypothetical protein n=1 Tax=Frankia sp. Cr1 TaxID=3073931 RepID=UPI002AD2C2D1|nr:hypothetical protein [Frankia sp. Cr1]